MRRQTEFKSHLLRVALFSVLMLPWAAREAVADNVNIDGPAGNIDFESPAGGVVGSATQTEVPTDPIEIPDPALGPSPPPPLLKELEEQASKTDAERPDQVGLQIREQALEESALSYGARGGLAFRTFEIQRRLAEYDGSLTKAFNFSRLLIAAPSGLLIEPPIVSEGQRAVLVNAGGQAAAMADRVYRINRVAKIVTSGRDWRLYLERDWGRVDPPPGILLPRDEQERKVWHKYVRDGWNAGVLQGEDIFEADLDRLTNDFVGMVRYRELLAQGMISAPYAEAENRGITGGGSEMRVGDRGVSITGQSALNPRSEQWTPAPR